MRETCPKLNESRIVKRFLSSPLTLRYKNGHQLRNEEYAYIQQEWYKPDSCKPFGWFDMYFVDSPDDFMNLANRWGKRLKIEEVENEIEEIKIEETGFISKFLKLFSKKT